MYTPLDKHELQGGMNGSESSLQALLIEKILVPLLTQFEFAAIWIWFRLFVLSLSPMFIFIQKVHADNWVIKGNCHSDSGETPGDSATVFACVCVSTVGYN